MIHIFNAMDWLNAIDHDSPLNNETRRLVVAAARYSAEDLEVKGNIERLRNSAYISSNPLEKAEILLCCAAIEYWRAWFPLAACDVAQALESYDGDHHRHAVALWMLGTVQWKMLKNHEAYRNWCEAKKLFQQRQILFQHFPEDYAWYKNHIWQMEVALVARPEEICTWLNRFERSSLRPPAREVIGCVWEKIHQQAYPNVYALMQDLQEANRRSEELYEKAEIYLEFGLAVYQMGNLHYAMDLLRKSVQCFSPGAQPYYKQVAARTLLGAVEWEDKLSSTQADVHWESCIGDFEKLRRQADRDNLPEKREWYAHRRDLLRAALSDRRKQNPRPPEPEEPVNGLPPGRGPHSSPPTPAARQTYSYEDLLRKVGWDRGTAERLIAYERKRAATANVEELIRRAIERWQHDNR